MKSATIRNWAIGAAIGLAALLIGRDSENSNVSHTTATTDHSTHRREVVQGPESGVGRETEGTPIVEAASTDVSEGGFTRVENSARTTPNSSTTDVPPNDEAGRQAWHLAHAIPAWTDLLEGLETSNRMAMQGPVDDLLRALESADSEGSPTQDELLERQRQLLGTLEHQYPDLFPIMEPMERIRNTLNSLGYSP